MAYCAECGTYMEDYDSNCPGCGQNTFSDIISNTEPALSKPEPAARRAPDRDDKSAAIINNPPGDFISNDDLQAQTEVNPEIGGNQPTFFETGENIANNSFVPQGMVITNQSQARQENHLGKGIIKPQRVEVDNEGVHFKYDIPAHSFIRNEAIKEKPVEFRITAAEMEFKDFNELFPVKENQEPELPEVLSIEESTEAGPELETQSISVTEPELSPEVEPEETMVEEPVIEPIQEEVIEMISETILEEPEIAKEIPLEILWEDRETWYRIPLTNQYRLTNRSLVIFDRYNNYFLEVPLPLITRAVIHSSWFAKLFNIGNLVISIRDFSASKLVLGGILKPAIVKRQLEIVCGREL